MSITRTSDYPDSLYPYLNKVFHEQYKDPTDTIESVMKVEQANLWDFEDLNLYGLGYLDKKKDETADASYDKGGQGYKTRYILEEYDKGVKVSYRMRRWAKVKEAIDKVKELGRVAKLSPIRSAFGIFRDATSATALSYGDNVSLINASHTSATGLAAQTNIITANPELGTAGYNLAELMLTKQVDERGIPIAPSGEKFIVLAPPALSLKGRQLVGSDLIPETANNGINVYKGSFTFITSVWISAAMGGSDSRWFVIDPGVAQLKFYWGDKPSFRKGTTVSSNVEENVVYSSWAKGWSDWRGVVSSSSAGS